ncbi:MAG: hypothetical protein OXT65_10250, partial [Alphaproteobacteria bacterium]|nr:hypothetical protein [Alphaproteobacteria bacterium]
MITGTAGDEVQITCQTNQSARNNGGCCGSASRPIDQPRFVVGTGNAVGPGLGNLCQGEDVNPVLHT